MITEFKIFENALEEGFFLVKDIYLKNAGSYDLTSRYLTKFLKDKLINIKNEQGTQIYGNHFTLISEVRPAEGGDFAFLLKSPDKNFYLYLNDTVSWRKRVFNENDPYGEEIWENVQEKTEDLVEKIKKFLIGEEYVAWEEFVDCQNMGDCQGIVYSIVTKFPQVKKIFGGIKLDEPCVDWDDGSENLEITHHWVEIDGDSYDFSKGTLKGYIDDIEYEMYDPEIYDGWRYSD